MRGCNSLIEQVSSDFAQEWEDTILNYVMLGIRSLQWSVPFYRDILGLKIVMQVEEEFVFFDVGNGLQLALRELGEENPGNTELVFGVEDIERSYEELKRMGVAFAREPRAVTRNDTAYLYATDFRDPDGRTLSITSWVPKRK